MNHHGQEPVVLIHRLPLFKNPQTKNNADNDKRPERVIRHGVPAKHRQTNEPDKQQRRADRVKQPGPASRHGGHVDEDLSTHPEGDSGQKHQDAWNCKRNAGGIPLRLLLRELIHDGDPIGIRSDHRDQKCRKERPEVDDEIKRLEDFLHQVPVALAELISHMG